MSTSLLRLSGIAAIVLASGVARAQHDDGTPDPVPRRTDLESHPVPSSPNGRGPGDAPGIVRRPPRTLPYYDFAPIPWGYRLKMGSGRYDLLLYGTLALGLGHTASILTGVGVGLGGCQTNRISKPHPDCGIHAGELAIPVVGPFFAFAGHGNSEPKAAYPVLGGVQVIGFVLLLAGATLDDKRLVRDDKFFPLAREVSLGPGPGDYGLGVRASF